MSNFLSQHCGNLVTLNSSQRDCMPGLLGISITAVGRDFICAEMPVDERTTQPFGILHGGASAAFAETLGSIASWILASARPGARVAGVEISASHLKAVESGRVRGICRPLRIGRTLHFWRIDIRNEAGVRCCAARLTVSVSVPGQESPDC